MGFLVPILLAAGVLALGQAGKISGLELPAAVPLLAALPYALAEFTRRRAMKGSFRVAALLSRFSSLGGVLAYWCAVWGLGWLQSVRRWMGQSLGLDDWPQAGLLLAFAPFVVFQLATIDAEVRTTQPPGRGRRRSFVFQGRMFLSALTPLALYVLVSVFIGLSPWLQAHVEWVDLIGAIFVAGLLAVLGTFLPSILRNTWETVPLPAGPQRTLFDVVASKADFTAREVLLWKTGNTMANAAIVGMTPGRRVVLLSDYLLGMLDPRQLATVFGHEIGHSKRHHVAVFLGWALFFFLGADLLVRWVFDGDELLGTAVLLGALVLWYITFGWLSRRFELEADLYSMQLTGDPEALIGALERVGGHSRDTSGWRHFSTRDRVRFLHRAAFDEVFRLRFIRRIRLLGRAGLILGFLVCAGQLLVRAGSWSEDRLRVQLALGDYGAVASQAAEIEEDYPEYLELARLGVQVEEELQAKPGPSAFEDRLTTALGAQDFEAARRWADLAALRGRRDLIPVANWLADTTEPSDEGPPEVSELPEPWRTRAMSQQ